MKKISWIALLALGMSTQISAEQLTVETKKTSIESLSSPNNVGASSMTEKEFILELDEEGAKDYQKLDAEGKALARRVASTQCAGLNLCKNLNTCRSEKNTCKGKGDCKGQGRCQAQPNLAVKLVKDKMAKKREDLQK